MLLRILPIFYRTYNYRPLNTKGHKYTFLFEDDESYTLIVNDLSILDAGEYTAIASNKAGKAESGIKLKPGKSDINIVVGLAIKIMCPAAFVSLYIRTWHF